MFWSATRRDDYEAEAGLRQVWEDFKPSLVLAIWGVLGLIAAMWIYDAYMTAPPFAIPVRIVN
jgi:hypothetical protein